MYTNTLNSFLYVLYGSLLASSQVSFKRMLFYTVCPAIIFTHAKQRRWFGVSLKMLMLVVIMLFIALPLPSVDFLILHRHPRGSRK